MSLPLLSYSFLTVIHSLIRNGPIVPKSGQQGNVHKNEDSEATSKSGQECEENDLNEAVRKCFRKLRTFH